MGRTVEFDFGPISRTVDASTGRKEAINFASLPLHEAMTALLGGSNRDEFIAWLWHDLFKPLFWWPQKDKWFHCPNTRPNDPLSVEARWSKAMGIGLVETHHHNRDKRAFTYGEAEIINNEFDQVAVGKSARFIQLSFLAEPATHTALLRAVIADAFMEVVTKAVAASIKAELASGSPTFKRVRYVFDFKRGAWSQSGLTTLSESEIASLAQQYTLEVTSEVTPDELVIRHLVPLAESDLDNHHVEVVIDLTDEEPTAERFSQGVISLVELLTVYQDSRTILMGIPQFLQVEIGQIQAKVKDATEQRLRALDIRTRASIKELKGQSKVQDRVDWSKLPLIRQGQDVDLLAHVLKEQVEIRIIERGELTRQVKGARGKTFEIRFLSEIVSRPGAATNRRCRFCGSAFESAFPAGAAVVGDAFTDIEYVGFGGDICPMCRIYMLNSHKSRTEAEKAKGITGDRQGYRGAFALVLPSSHFTYDEKGCQLIERPPLDIGGRFAASLQRATVTLQEYALFNMLSRRIIARLWATLEGQNASRPLPLPYLGAILLTQKDSRKVRAMFDCLELLFDQVRLRAYPFEVIVRPSVELAFEMAVNDLKQHHTKHTYLKTNPTVVSVGPESKFTLLVDNGLQMEVSREFFEDRRRMNELLERIKGRARRRDWLRAVLQGMDPVTAAMEVFSDSDDPLAATEQKFWDVQGGDLTTQWKRYEEVRNEIGRIVARYPMLIEFFI